MRDGSPESSLAPASSSSHHMSWAEWAVPGVKMLDADEAEHSGQWSPPTRARDWGGAGPGQCGAAERGALCNTDNRQSAVGSRAGNM